MAPPGEMVPRYPALHRALLYIAGAVISVIGWLVVLFTGRYPRPFHDFVVGLMRWSLPVQAYTTMLVTDRYRPFHLGA